MDSAANPIDIFISSPNSHLNPNLQYNNQDEQHKMHKIDGEKNQRHHMDFNADVDFLLFTKEFSRRQPTIAALIQKLQVDDVEFCGFRVKICIWLIYMQILSIDITKQKKNKENN